MQTPWRRSLRSLRLYLFCNLGEITIESVMSGYGKSLNLKESSSSSLPSWVVCLLIVRCDLVFTIMLEASREAWASGNTSRVSWLINSFFLYFALSLSSSNCNCASSNSISVISVSSFFYEVSTPLGVESNNFSILIGFKENLDVLPSSPFLTILISSTGDILKWLSSISPISSSSLSGVSTSNF